MRMALDMAADHPPTTTLASQQARFEALVAAHRGIVFKVATIYTRSRDDRQDLVQEILAQTWRAFPYYDESRRFSTWLYRVALNVAISARRRAGVRDRATAAADPGTLAAVSAEPDPRVRELYRVIDRLGAYDRALVMLYLEGHDQRTMREILGISEANVATRLTRIRRQLRDEAAGVRTGA